MASSLCLYPVCTLQPAWLTCMCSRAAAVDVVSALARRCRSADDLGKMFAALRRVLDGASEAKPRGVHERMGLVQALATLAAAPCSSPGDVALAEDAAGFLSALYR